MPDLKRARIDVKIAEAEVTALKRKLAASCRGVRAEQPPGRVSLARLPPTSKNLSASKLKRANDAQPDNLQVGPFGQKCDEICGIDLESALSTLQEAEGAEVPLGFGRD